MIRPCRIHLTTKKTYAFTDLFPSVEKEPAPEDDFDEDLDEDLDGDEEDFFPTDDFGKAELFPDLPARPEFTTALEADGTLTEEEDGSLALCYSDPYVSGQTGSSTAFRFYPSGLVTLTSTGQWTSCMAFENGKRVLCDYGAKGGVYSVTMHTHRLETDLSPLGGTFSVEYSVEIHGSVSEHNLLELSVTLL